MPVRLFSSLKSSFWFIPLLVVSLYTRFSGLGYSHFYGDEVKTFYLDKTIPAAQFFLNQRKGPFQFLVVWIMEKFTGGYDEFLTRVPFALAGFLSVIVFYVLVNKLFGSKVALISSTLFSLSGFNIAFSRTIQYQSFLILFGLLSIYFCLLYLKEERKKRLLYAAVSSVFLALSYLSHYDAVFLNIVVGFLLIRKLTKANNNGDLKNTVKEILLYYILPFLIIIIPFFIPYIAGGFFHDLTQSYIGRRLFGVAFDPNHSGYTFWVYNPSLVWIGLLVFVLPYFFRKISWEQQMVMLWFLTAFITFELVFSNPGTHIHNYFIPLFILIGLGIDSLYNWIPRYGVKLLYTFTLVLGFSWLTFVSLNVFVPSSNNGYPWKSAKIGLHARSRINKSFHLFLYGFTYNRGWDQISKYFDNLEGVRGVYTNDNDTLAQYYLYGLDYTPPGANFLPQYYVHVFNNQEFNDIDPFDLTLYEKQQEFFVNGDLASIVYKLK